MKFRDRRRSFGRRVAERAEMAAVRLGEALALTLPDERAAGRIGAFAVPRLPFLRRRVGDNLRHVHPEASEAEIRRLCAGVGDHFARVVIEYLRMDRIVRDPTRLLVEDDASLREAVAAGRGAVIASAHFGCWEAVRLAARQATGRDCALIYRAFNNPLVDAWARGLIEPAGVPVLHKGREGMRALVRHISGGGVALILVDQRQTGAPLIPFLGREAETATAAAALALRFGAALIPARGKRLPDGRFSVRFEPEATPGLAEAMMTEVNARIDDWVEEAPEQWFWLHRRWRHRGERGKRMRAARTGRSPEAKRAP